MTTLMSDSHVESQTSCAILHVLGDFSPLKSFDSVLHSSYTKNQISQRIGLAENFLLSR